MTCDRRLLSYYRDGQVSADERYYVERHLKDCADCRRELQGMVRIGQVIRSLPFEPAPPSIGREVRRKIAEREAARRRPIAVGGLARGFAPAAAFASVALALTVVLSGGEDGRLFPRTSPAGVASQPEPAAPSAQEPAAAPAPAPTREVSLSNPRVNPATGTVAAGARMPRPIERLYAARSALREQLGAPVPGSRTVTLLEQSFQGGLAIWRSDTRQIYVLRREGSAWQAYAEDAVRPSQAVAIEAPPPGAMVPAGGFGALWRATPEVKSRLGWAVYEPRGSGGTIQAFERGVVVWSPHGLIYVLTNDGRWRTFPDAPAG